MATIRPSDLPAAASVNPAAVLIVDDGTAVEKATPIQVVDAAIPLASQAEAEAGTDNAKRVTPLRVAQAIDALGVSAADLALADGVKGSELVGFLPAGTGAGARTAQTKMREQASITDFDTPAHPVVGDNSTDCSDGIQLAIDALMAGEIGKLVIPLGIFRHSGPLEVPDNIITGKRITGLDATEGRLRQMTNNEPHFLFSEVNLMHSCQFDNFAMDWANAQTGNDAATCFRFLPKAAVAYDVYRCHFHDLFVDNCHTFARGETVNFWGNKVQRVFCSTDGAFVNLQGVGGQPTNLFEVYILGGAAGEIMFDCGAMRAEYFVEVNGTSAMMLRDYSGGTHMIRHWALETATFGADGTLFDMLNSSLICPTLMYFASLTLTGTAHIRGFATSVGGRIKVEDLDWDFTSQAAGSKLTMLKSADVPCEFGRLLGALSAANATPVAQLTDVASTATANNVTVREWLDPSRLTLAGDGSSELVLDYDDPMTIIVGAVPLAADLVIKLPRHDGVSGNNLFRGPRWKIVKLANAGTTYKIDAKTYNAGTTVATIPAATASGKKEMRWDRASPVGTAGVGFWTDEPLPI